MPLPRASANSQLAMPPKPKVPRRLKLPLADVRGALQLAVTATQQVTGLVETLHGQIQRLALPLRRRRADTDVDADHDGLPGAQGLTHWVYRSIQATTRLAGGGVAGLLAALDLPRLAPPETAPRRDAWVAALNGVLGDHLQRSGNPLAVPMQLRQNGLAVVDADLQAAALAAAAALSDAVASPVPPGSVAARPGRLLLMIHGLCMSDLGWCREGHDHGQHLAADLGLTPVYAWYNSGLHIATNGALLADRLERLLITAPDALQELVIVGHSMGGLVARSACHQAMAAGHAWPARLQKMVFLGSPHHGAPLERGGNWLHRAMGLSPYVAPFTRLTGLRSDGITDLRHGRLLAADWQGAARFDARDLRRPVPLPAGVACYAMASLSHVAGPPAALRRVAPLASSASALLGDGLVPLNSALGRHRRRALHLGFPKDRQWVGQGIHHLALLNDPQVYRQLLAWLSD